MGQENNSTNKRSAKHINWEKRIILERMYRYRGKDQLTIKQMANFLDTGTYHKSSPDRFCTSDN